MKNNKTPLPNFSLFTIHFSLILVLFIGLISCGDDSSDYYHYDWVINDVEHKADMPIIQYYMDSLREDFKDSLILMGYDEDSIEIRDSVFLEEYSNGTKDEEMFYNGGAGYEDELFNFDVYNSVKWMIIATMDDTTIKRKKKCNINMLLDPVMQTKEQVLKDEPSTIRVVDDYIKNFTAKLKETPTNSTPKVWDRVQVSSSQGLKYRVDFEYKGLKNWQEGQVDFYEKEQQDASACETGIYMGH